MEQEPDKENAIIAACGPLDQQSPHPYPCDSQQQQQPRIRSSWLCLSELELDNVLQCKFHSINEPPLLPAPRTQVELELEQEQEQQPSQSQQHYSQSPQHENFQQAFENGRILPYIVDCMTKDDQHQGAQALREAALEYPVPAAERQWNGYLPLAPVVVHIDAPPSVLVRKNRHTLPSPMPIPMQSSTSITDTHFPAHLQLVCLCPVLALLQ
jgi:hypothetical protein